MDIKFTSQFIDKVIGDCLKQVAACWNSTFGILGLLIPEQGRDIPDRPKIRSSLKKSSFLSFCYQVRRALVSVKTTRVGRFVAPPCFWELLHWAMVPSGDIPSRRSLCALFRVTAKFWPRTFQKASGASKANCCTSVCTMLMRRDRKALTQL